MKTEIRQLLWMALFGYTLALLLASVLGLTQWPLVIQVVTALPTIPVYTKILWDVVNALEGWITGTPHSGDK